MSKSTLKITRHDDRRPPGDVSFEVWNPISARYEPMDSLDDGLNRVTEVAKHVRGMRVQHDPARTSLKYAPDPDDDDDSEWAELRANAWSIRVYETRSFDQKGWKKAMSRSAAVETVRNEIGYIPL